MGFKQFLLFVIFASSCRATLIAELKEALQMIKTHGPVVWNSVKPLIDIMKNMSSASVEDQQELSDIIRNDAFICTQYEMEDNSNSADFDYSNCTMRMNPSGDDIRTLLTHGLEFSCDKDDSMKSCLDNFDSKKYTIVLLLGKSNAGKSLIASRLCGNEVPYGRNNRTEGACFVTGSGRENYLDKQVVVIDFEGIYQRQSDDGNKDRATDSAYMDFLMRLASVTILVTDNLNRQDNTLYLDLLRRSRELGNADFMVIHNNQGDEKPEDLLLSVKDSIESYNHAKKVDGVHGNTYYWVYHEDDVTVQHLVLGRHGSYAGKDNTLTWKYLVQKLNQLPPRDSVFKEDKIAKHLEFILKRYFAYNTNPCGEDFFDIKNIQWEMTGVYKKMTTLYDVMKGYLSMAVELVMGASKSDYITMESDPSSGSMRFSVKSTTSLTLRDVDEMGRPAGYDPLVNYAVNGNEFIIEIDIPGMNPIVSESGPKTDQLVKNLKEGNVMIYVKETDIWLRGTRLPNTLLGGCGLEKAKSKYGYKVSNIALPTNLNIKNYKKFTHDKKHGTIILIFELEEPEDEDLW